MVKVLSAAVIIVIITAVAVSFLLSKRKSGYSKNETIDPLKLTIKDIDRMEDGTDFEEYLYRLFLALGYSDVYKTRGSRDFGSDLVFTDSEGPGEVTI